MATDPTSVPDTQEVSIFCKQCRRNIFVNVSTDQLQQSTGGICTIVSLHGEPSHAIMVYLDQNLMVRGIDYPHVARDRSEVQVATESDVEKLDTTIDVDLSELLDVFGKNTKKNVKALSALIMQIMLSNPVYIVHSDPSVGEFIQEKLTKLFTQQEMKLTVIDPSGISDIKERQPLIYNIIEGKYLYEGIKMDSHHFERIINESRNKKDSYFRIKNELSKVYYAYEKMKYAIATTDEKLKETQLAKDIAIELTLMPLLLKMAEAQEINVKDRVETDGMARALRSI